MLAAFLDFSLVAGLQVLVRNLSEPVQVREGRQHEADAANDDKTQKEVDDAKSLSVDFMMGYKAF
jgi:hypothetical protein